jgi:hypothetical protein
MLEQLCGLPQMSGVSACLPLPPYIYITVCGVSKGLGLNWVVRISNNSKQLDLNILAGSSWNETYAYTFSARRHVGVSVDSFTICN